VNVDAGSQRDQLLQGVLLAGLDLNVALAQARDPAVAAPIEHAIGQLDRTIDDVQWLALARAEPAAVIAEASAVR
jgi:hypothetical protein